MRTIAYLLAAALLSNFSVMALAQEANEPAPAPADLESLKSALIDATPGIYVAPVLSASYISGTSDNAGVAIDFDGYLLLGGGAVGYELENVRLQVDAVLGTSQVEIDDNVPVLGGTDLDIFTVSFVGNAFYDLPIDIGKKISPNLPSIMPYVGAGLGWIYLDVDGDSDDGLLTQAMTGLGFRITPRLTLDVGYRYLYIPRIAPQDIDSELDAHTAEARARYRF